MASAPVVFFDMDGVLIPNKGYVGGHEKVAVGSWNSLFYELGILNEHANLRNRFVNGEFSGYMDWTDAACKVLQKYGMGEKFYRNFVNSRHFSLGALETIQTLKRNGYKTALITGSFQELVDRCKEELGLDRAIGHCEFVFEKGALHSWRLTPCDFDGKVHYGQKIAEELGVPYSECIHVGDSVNDIYAFGKVRLAIAFNPDNKAVRNSAHVVVEGEDLRAVSPHILKL